MKGAGSAGTSAIRPITARPTPSVRNSQRPNDDGVFASVGAKGDSYDSAMTSRELPGGALGLIRECFPSNFAMAEGRLGGEFFTTEGNGQSVRRLTGAVTLGVGPPFTEPDRRDCQINGVTGLA